MSVLLHLSDTHFGTERPTVVKALQRLIQEQAPDLLVLSGDVTQRATAAQFRAAHAFLDSLAPRPVLVIPGNHDIPLFDVFSRFLRPYARYQRALGPVLEPEHAGPDLLVVGVNATRRYRHVEGTLSRAQIAQVATRLAAGTAQQLRIVAVHQPIAVITARDEVHLLRRHAQAARCWSAAGADLVLGGHIHLPYVCPVHEQQPQLARRLWAVQAGTALSTRIRGGTGNSVNLIRHQPDARQRCCIVERWDYAEEQDMFVCDRRETLPLSPVHAGAAGRSSVLAR